MAGKHGSAQDRADAKTLELAGRPDLGDVRRLERWRGELRLGPLEDASQEERTAHWLALAELIGPGRGKNAQRIAYLMVCRHGLATPLYRELLVEHWVANPDLVERWARSMGPLDVERYDLVNEAELAADDAALDSEPSEPSYKLFVAMMETVVSNLSSGVPTEPPEAQRENYLTDSLTPAFGAAPADPEIQARAVGYQGDVPPQLAEAFGPATIPFPKAAGEIASSGDLRLLARIAQGIVPAARMMVETSTMHMTEEELAEACALTPPAILGFLAVSPAPPNIAEAMRTHFARTDRQPMSSG